MMSFTNALELQILDKILGLTEMTLNAATLYVGLSTTTPADDGTSFTEPSGGSYARASVVNNGTNWPAATSPGGVGTKSNGTAITFVTATAPWGTVTHWGLWTAASGGTLILKGSLTSPQAVGIGDTVIFPAGDMTITLD